MKESQTKINLDFFFFQTGYIIYNLYIHKIDFQNKTNIAIKCILIEIMNRYIVLVEFFSFFDLFTMRTSG